MFCNFPDSILCIIHPKVKTTPKWQIKKAIEGAESDSYLNLHLQACKQFLTEYCLVFLKDKETKKTFGSFTLEEHKESD